METVTTMCHLSNRSIAVIGAGNGGQAIAAFMASLGCEVRLHDRNRARIEPIVNSREIELTGSRCLRAQLAMVSDDLAEVVSGAKIIMVVTTADAHGILATKLAPILEEDQLIVLNPGRTGGALEFRTVLKRLGMRKRVFVSETQSLVYACRSESVGRVRIIGEKCFLPVAALPRTDTADVVQHLRHFYPCMHPAEHVLRTSFENIGAIFHTAIVIFNAATIERATPFFFYQDMSPAIADFLLHLDEERLALGRAYGMKLISITDWIRKAYPESSGDTLCDLMRNNAAYNDIRAPDSLDSRYLYEDIPAGLVPFCAFADAAGLRLPLMTSLILLGSSLLGRDFLAEGRNLERLGLKGMCPQKILEAV